MVVWTSEPLQVRSKVVRIEEPARYADPFHEDEPAAAFTAAMVAGDAYGTYTALLPCARCRRPTAREETVGRGICGACVEVEIEDNACVACGRLMDEGEARVSTLSHGAPVCWSCREPEGEKP